MKAALEALKRRDPRLPLPPDDGAEVVHNGRMRNHYLPASWIAGFAPRRQPTGPGAAPAPAASAEEVLFTSCFWIVSRVNNCHYCLGHQELKLAHAGLADSDIAALDGDWDQFDERSQRAFQYAQQLTLAPHELRRQHVEALRDHFTDQEILDLTFAIARFNATNRWTDSLGIPQDGTFRGRSAVLTVPTAADWQNFSSRVAIGRLEPRPAPSAAELRRLVEACRDASPVLAVLADRSTAADSAQSAGWEHALAQATQAGPACVESLRTMFDDDHLPPRLKAEIAWLTAASNRAGYALDVAARRLQRLDAEPPELPDAAAEPGQASSPAAIAHRFAVRLTVAPQAIRDEDVAAVRTNWGDAATAQIIHVIAMGNLFDRFTAALGLPLDAPEKGVTE
jgi:alkylhydroperoxidase family enzyme